MTTPAASALPWAVVTVFQPREVPGVIAALAGTVSGIVVVDDGSPASSETVLQEISAQECHLIRLEENSGIAAALNRGIAEARERGAADIVTFDQDSAPPAGMVTALLRAHRSAVDDGASAGPVVPEYFSGVRQTADTTSPYPRAERVIQSGMLIPGAVLDAVGGMDETLFIDLVDTDFELRCAEAGMPCIAARGLRMDHSLGAQYRAHGLLGRVLPTLTLSTPFRYYYRARNRVIVNRRYPAHRSRLRRDGWADWAYFVIAWTLARPRRTLRALLSRGLRDGRAGRGGRIPDALAAEARQVIWNADRL